MKGCGMIISPNLLIWSILGIVLVVMVIALLREIAKQITKTDSRSGFKSNLPAIRAHIPTMTRGEFGDSWETDIRLTYKRFKEIYPYSKISYREYKELQRRKAFRRAVSSQQIERMVR